MDREPALVVGAVGALIASALGLLAIFGLDLSADTQTQIVTAVTSIVGALVILIPLIRGMVYSPASAKQIEKGAQPAPMDAAPPHPLP